MKEIYAYIDNHFEDVVEDLMRLCRQPSVSAQNLGIAETAHLVAEMLEEAGVASRILPTPGGPPLVYGELAGKSPTTLLFYNHYDVQPPEPLELWATPPFEPTRYDGKLRGRGVADNKGNIAARLAAIKAFRSTRGSLPVSIKFCIEGEEEVGSSHLTAFVEQNRDLLQADACLWEGGGVNWNDQPVISLGLKGILYVELEARTASRDVHSSNATVVPNAAWRLVWALASLKDTGENILIQGFRDSIRPPTPDEVNALKAIPSEEAEFQKNLGLSGFLKNVSGFDFRLRHFLEPTCTICGLSSGYTGQGAKTVLPSVARAKLDFRLVPDQRPEDILAKLRHHLDSHGFQDITIAPGMEGENPARTPLNSPFVKLVSEAAREVYEREPVLVPMMAGSGPMFPFTNILGLPTASCGIEYPDSRFHAPDENIRLHDLSRGIKHIAAILERLSKGC